VPDLDWIAAYQAQVEADELARRTVQQDRQTAALAAGTAGEYTITPDQTGWGATSIAPLAMNTTDFPSSRSILVGWGDTSGPGDPVFDAMLADAARYSVANTVYDPSVSQGLGGYTSKPGVRDRILAERAATAAALREAAG